jgi:hypothetical protein
MPGNPQIPLGTLNRLRGSIVVPANTALNVTAPYLGKEGIRLGLDGDATVYLPAMAGAVTSPEPYMMATILVHLLKTQNLASIYKQQMETMTLIGDVTITPDTAALDPYNITNCAISSVAELNFSGDDAGWNVTLRGYYLINSALWDLAL